MSIKKVVIKMICTMCLLMAVIVCPRVAEAAETSLQVGAAVRDITPTKENGMLPISTGLARQNLVDVIDPLHVRVIAVNDGQKTALMIWQKKPA